MFEVYTKEEIEIIKTVAQESSAPISDDRAYTILRKLSFFDGVDEKTLYESVKSIKLGKYEKGETIITEGETDDTIFLLVKGAVAVFKNRRYEKNRLVGVLKEKEVFGEMSLLLDEPRSATVRVSTTQSLILSFKLDKEKLDGGKISKSSILIYKNIAKSLAHKLEALNNRFCI